MDSNKDDIGSYLTCAFNLLSSMEADGYDADEPVPVDPNGDILGGAHRTACALALGLDVAVEPHEQLAWAPEWGASWFRQHGAPAELVEDLLLDYASLKGD